MIRTKMLRDIIYCLIEKCGPPVVPDGPVRKLWALGLGPMDLCLAHESWS